METQATKSNGSTALHNDNSRFKAEPSDDFALAAARRKFEAAKELLMSFEPGAEQLTEAARALVKIAHKGMRGE